jgi:small-conductance mechanosensitive channel
MMKPMNTSIDMVWDRFLQFLHSTWFQLGTTDVTAARVLGLLVILVGAWWGAQFVEETVRRVSMRRSGGSMSEPGIYALGRILRYVIWIVGSIVGLSFIGFDLASLAILGGAVGVGVGFGLQNIFSNLMSGVIILLEKTLKVVAEINMRYTRITTNDAVDVIVPNSEFINGRVVNWTLGEQLRRVHVPFGVAYGTDKEKVKTAGLAAAQTLSYTCEDATHKADVWLVSLGDSSLNFELVVWVGIDGVRAPSKVQAAYLWAIETELNKAGIEIPFPQRDLHMRSGQLQVQLVDKLSKP